MKKPLHHHHLRNAFLPHQGNDYRPHALRHHWLHTYAVALVTIKILVIAAVSFMAGPAWQTNITSSTVIVQTNEARKGRNISTLKVSPKLMTAARSKAESMIREQYFAHFSPKGTSPWHWFRKAGYQYRYAGENLAIDFVDSEDVIAAWLRSPTHRQNLLNGKYKEIGVAVASGEIQGAQSVVVVQLFGTPVVTSPVKRTSVAAAPAPQTATTVPKPTTPTKTVLGESEPQPTPPNVPVISKPTADELVHSSIISVEGRTSAGASITLLIDDQPSGTTTADSQGMFRVSSDTQVSDGVHRYLVQADRSGLTSRMEAATLTIDTSAPVVDDQRTVMVPSLLHPQGYDVLVGTSPDTLRVSCLCGPSEQELASNDQGFAGYVEFAGATMSGPLRFHLIDRAGNATKVSLYDQDVASSGVMVASGSSRLAALKLVLYSKTFTAAFLTIMFLLALINIVHQWERRHHPTLVGSLMVMYLAGALLLL